MDQPLPGERTRPSASVLLLRGDGVDLEVYLAKRGPRTRFFPGYHVFPGGVLDREDGDGEPARRCAALRELFEETGVLVVRGRVPPDLPRDALRARAAAGERIEDDLARAGLSWDEDRLVEAGRILTPPFSPVRYDTSFFLCRLPEGESPTVDGVEMVTGAWWRPGDALARWAESPVVFRVPPPTLAYLHLLVRHPTPPEAAAAARATDGRPHWERFRIEFHPGIDVLPLRAPTLPPATTQNCFLLDADPLVVVDPGAPEAEHQAPLLSTLERMGARGRRGVVILTHHHVDHVAAAEAVRSRFGFPVLAHAETAKRLASGLVDETVEEGHRLDLGTWRGRPWRLALLHTPGHAPGHLVVRDERWGAILAGDLVSGVSTILVDPDTGHMGEYMASLERCAELDPPIVLPGHGPALPGRAFRSVLEHRRMREAKVLAALGPDPRPLGALLPVVYDDTPRAQWVLAERSLLAHLLELQREGRARGEPAGWRLA